MKDDRKLLAGLDLTDDMTQLSCYDEKKGEPVAVGRQWDGEREYECPTVLAWNREKREWFYGLQAAREAEDGHAVLMDHFIRAIQSGEEYQRYGMVFTGEELLFRFLVKVLNCLKEYYPDERLRRLVISIPERNEHLVRTLQNVMERLGIAQERYTIQPHKQSYIYYALSQKKELWMNNVGLFEFGRDGLFYSQLTLDKRTIPYIAGVQRKDLRAVMNWSMLQTEEKRSLEVLFLNLARKQLHRQMVTTIYICGEGFEQPWAENALRQLCSGRRIFRGRNLFTRGACYAAKALSEKGRFEDYIFLDEEMAGSTISMQVYSDAKMQDIIVAQAGTPWREIDTSLDIIPDGEEEIRIVTQNILRRETKEHLLSLEGFPNRPNKMTRFTVRFRFADANTCIVTLKDNGFGEFCPSSNRIWERYISV